MDNEEHIEELIQQEVKILRNLLSNLKEEQNALLNKNLDALDEIIDERIDYVRHFEELALQLLDFTNRLAKKYNKRFLVENGFNHSKALEFLREMIPVDHIELHSLFGQLEALVHEIENQNSMTKYFLQTKSSSSLRLTDARAEEKRKKVQLELLDPGQE